MKLSNRTSRVISRCSRGQGVVRYGKTAKFGVPASREYNIRNTQEIRDYFADNRLAHKLDRERQRREAGTNWELVRFILDNRKDLTLEEAKTLANSI